MHQDRCVPISFRQIALESQSHICPLAAQPRPVCASPGGCSEMVTRWGGRRAVLFLTAFIPIIRHIGVALVHRFAKGDRRSALTIWRRVTTPISLCRSSVTGGRKRGGTSFLWEHAQILHQRTDAHRVASAKMSLESHPHI